MTSATDLLPVTNGSLTLDARSAPGDVLADQLARITGGAPIVVRAATRTVAGNTVTVTGRADVLNVPDVPVTVTAAPGADGPVVTARFVLIEGAPTANAWRFSRSFPTLAPLFVRPPTPLPEGAAIPHLLDSLVLSDAALVLTTAESIDAVTQAPLVAGLNFVARCAPTGFLGLLGSVVSGGGPVKLYGPISIPRPTELTLPIAKLPALKFPWQLPSVPPGIHLVADLGVDHRLGSALRLHDVGLRIYCPASKAWAAANPTFAPIVAASAKLAIPSAQMTLDLTALGIENPNRLSLYGIFEGVTLANLGALVDLAGAGDLASALPDDVKSALGKLELTSISIALGSGMAVQQVGVGVGMPGIDTNILPGFTLRDLTANFSVNQPFASSRSVALMLEGSVDFIGIPLDVAVYLPEGAAHGRTTGAISVPLSAIFGRLGLPQPPDLTVNELQAEIAKDGTFGFAARAASGPAWTIDLGPVPLTIADVAVIAKRSAQAGSSARLGGVISLGDDVRLAVAYETPGNFTMRGELPEVRLLQLIGKLANQALPLPGGFDITLTDASVLIEKSGPTDLTFQLAATVPDFGLAAFEARRVAGQNAWGFAFGADLSRARLSSLPGLGALKPFDDLFQLDQLTVVAASFADPGFQFPALAAFASPTLAGGRLALPSSGGVIAGLNIHAQWTLGGSQEQELLRKLLSLEPHLAVTVQVGKIPAQDTRLYVGYATAIGGMPLVCQFGAQLKGSQAAFFLSGTLKANIQGKPIEFQVEMLFVAGGAFISGSMVGSVSFEGLTLSNLALVIGVNWAGVPSGGIACTLSVQSFQSSLALFVDSTQPSRSLVAGAVSNLSLKDVVETIARGKVPGELEPVLTFAQLLHTREFAIDAALAEDLDNLKLERVAAAFAANGVTLPASSQNVLLVKGEQGKSWFVTNLADNMRHYQLERAGNRIRVMLNPQFYCVPQTSSIGALRFEQGFFLSGRLKTPVLDGSVTILVNPSQGIAADGEMNRLIIWKEQLFSLTSADGKGGPRVSVATFSQPTHPDPNLRRPHFLIDGNMRLLGLSRRTYVTASEQGFAFALDGQVAPALSVDLKGRFNSLQDFTAGGTLDIGVGRIDLGPLGSVNIGTGVKARLDASFNGSAVKATVAGGFQFAGETLSIPNIDLNLDEGLLQLPRRAADEVAKVLKAFLSDVGRWVALVGRALIGGVADMAGTLKDTFKVPLEDAAKHLKAAGQSAEAAVAGLKSAYGATADQAAKALQGANYAANEVGGALTSAYGATAGALAEAGNVVGGALADAAKSVFGGGSRSEQHLFYRDGIGRIVHIWFDGAMRGPDQWNVRAAPAVGDPAVMATAREQHLFYRGAGGLIHHIWWGGQLSAADQWNQIVGAPQAVGDPAAMSIAGEQHLFYRDAEGWIQHINWDGRFHGYNQWNKIVDAPRAAGDPAAMSTRSDEQHLFYRDHEGWIQHINWDGRFHGYDQWNRIVKAPRAAGDPAAMSVGGEQHLFYRDAAGLIQHIWWSDGDFHGPDQWNARAPRAAGDPAVMATRSGEQHLFYRDVAGLIQHMWWGDGSLRGPDQWIAAVRAPPAVGDPAALASGG